jgi:hypothetical protein
VIVGLDLALQGDVVLTLIAGKTRKPLPFKPSWGSIIAMFTAVA